MRSMSMRMFCLSAVLGAIGMLICCNEPGQRLNAPPQGASERPHEMQDTYVYMHDNAMMAEMSMSPVHFMPNRSDPNALGLRRLLRYVDLLKECGGTLHYDGFDDPEPLARERVDCIKSFLVEAGVDPATLIVEVGVAGGSGMTSQEAVAIRDFGKFSSEQQSRQSKGGAWDDKGFQTSGK